MEIGQKKEETGLRRQEKRPLTANDRTIEVWNGKSNVNGEMSKWEKQMKRTMLRRGAAFRLIPIYIFLFGAKITL